MKENRITERRYRNIPPQNFIADGTVSGVVTISSTINFKVKQSVVLQAAGQPTIELQIQQVLSDTQLIVGALKSPIHSFYDISAYTVGANATILCNEQQRPVIPEQEITRIIYDEEPTLAHRNVLVDWLGNYYTTDNPLPVQLSDGSINIDTINANLAVQITHLDNWPNVGDVHDSVRIGDGTDVLDINPDGSINVQVLPGALNPIIYTDLSSFSDASETAVFTYTASQDNENITNLFADADTYGTWRFYRGNTIDPNNMFMITRTSALYRNANIRFTQPEILQNIGDQILITFQADQYRTGILGASASAFIRIEGYKN